MYSDAADTFNTLNLRSEKRETRETLMAKYDSCATSAKGDAMPHLDLIHIQDNDPF